MSTLSSPGSVGSSAGKSPQMLTPRSKVRALLAAFDDSDSESSPTKNKGQSAVNQALSVSGREKSAVSPASSRSSQEDSEDSVTAPKPRGRLVSRMRDEADSKIPRSTNDVQPAQNSKPNSPSFESDKSPEIDAVSQARQEKPRVQSPRESTPSPGSDAESDDSSSSESDMDLNTANYKLKALVAQKRALRRAAERAAKEKRRAATRALAQRTPAIEVGESEDDGEDEIQAGRSLTQHSKPTRKASKKALEEINRETQRMSRNQQLAHQMQVKKKITKQDLFKRFNFNTAPETVEEKPAEEKSEDEAFMMSGALLSSDVETERQSETLPTSPVSDGNQDETKATFTSHEQTVDTSMEISMDAQPTVPESNAVEDVKSSNKKPVTRLAPTVIAAAASDNSDDDLEIVFAKPKPSTIFDHLPANKARLSNPMRALMHLANLKSPGKNRHGKGKNLTFKGLQVQLLEQARKQARQDKEERINELRARGIHVQTAEEREKEQLELENLLEKARQDADVLAKKEKSDAKSEEGEDGSDDEDYAEPIDTDSELAGSDADDADDEDGESEAGNPFFDEEAEDADTDGESEAELEDIHSLLHNPSSSAPKQVGSAKAPTKTTKRRVILDDEDDDDEPQPVPASQKAGFITAAGLQKSMMAGFGMSQIFAGTLADSETQSGTMVQEQESLALFGELAPGTPPAMDSLYFGSRLVPDSQNARAEKPLPELNLPISQLPSQPIESPSKMSEVEFTQDVGFAIPRAPIGRRDIPPSTSETVLFDTPEKKGKLRRKASLVAVLSDADDDDAVDVPDAFDTLFKGAKKRADANAFDKKKSAARNLVEEQAEESEDEYKGIGGASDDESNAEYDEEVAQMIDHGHVDVDEMEIAALHADKERQDDEKRINKLYKDVTTGMLRRKRGGDMLDLDDSDDDLAERRRRKQEEFARMRNALLADEKVGKIAQNPKQQAFFLAIEDREDSNMLDFMDAPEIFVPDSQAEQPENAAPALGGDAVQPERPALSDISNVKETIPLKSARGSLPTTTLKRPTTLEEIRNSVSALFDDPIVPDSQPLLSDDDEDVDMINPLSRTDTTHSIDSAASKTSIVNRLLRGTHPGESTSGPLAFQAHGSTASPAFKIPSLLRRTTNLSTTSNSSSGTGSSSNGVKTNGGSGTRVGGSRKSNMHYQAYEAERKKAVEEAERKRKAQVKKTVMATKGRGIMGLLRGKGNGFE